MDSVVWPGLNAILSFTLLKQEVRKSPPFGCKRKSQEFYQHTTSVVIMSSWMNGKIRVWDPLRVRVSVAGIKESRPRMLVGLPD